MQDEPPKKAKSGQPTQKKRKKTPKVLGRRKGSAPEKIQEEADALPKQPKVPEAPPKKQCTRCGRWFLAAEMLPYHIRKDGHFYRQILELCKGEAWLKNMLQRQKEELVHKQITKIETGKVKKLTKVEPFCELCWNRLNLDLEYRRLQHENTNVLHINKAKSMDCRAEQERYYKFHDVPGLGKVDRSHQKFDRKNLRDPSLVEKLYASKLTKWRLFVYCDKFINFDKNVIHDLFHKGHKERVAKEAELKKQIEDEEFTAAKRTLPPLHQRSHNLKNNPPKKPEQAEKERPRRDHFKLTLKFPLMLQVKLGEARADAHADEKLLRKVDSTMI